ncbi:transcriptional regulator/sugar kinase [Aciduliprofundum sp. MAR08-339]|uniref:ROK family protein n=1 Tax=Aciduliprofundum sp. (strain MAR08-339) TaxID=673860 RepID=UPI0002A4C8B5|nr:transcriptional regulator/sugar kinase [Aciduliprofundum sp. MAR08-339]
MVLGIDVGGTKILAARVEDGKILNRWKTGTRNGKVIATLRSIISQAGESRVGIAVPCYLRNGVCIKSPNIPELDGKILQDHFEGAIVMNDCTAMAYGEYFLRGGKYDPLLLVALGTGVGAGFVYKSSPYVGRGSAMEIGHLKGFSEMKCYCGRRGCLETVLGGRYNDLPRMEKMARNGEKEGLRFMEEYGRTLARGIATAIQLLDPEIVVIGGSAARAYDLFERSMKEELHNLLSFITPDDIIFERARSEESGALGAALIADRGLI